MNQSTPSAYCGDWSRADIYSRWPTPIADELSSFQWPIRTYDELLRLFECAHAAPVSVCGGEFTAAVRTENERVYLEITISCDFRASLIPGVHACMDMRIVIAMRSRTSGRGPWLRAYLFPPCTHQTLSDTTAREAKELDGRRFWGILLVIWCWCTYALMLLVEQPDTVIPRLYRQPTQRFKTMRPVTRTARPSAYSREAANLSSARSPSQVPQGTAISTTLPTQRSAIDGGAHGPAFRARCVSS